VPRYFFNLNDGRRIIPDLEGTELPDHESARAHGCQVVRELARNREQTTRSWRLAACDAHGAPYFELAFASVDEPVSAVMFPLSIPAQQMMPRRSAERHKEP
jgi:hypothetical protein